MASLQAQRTQKMIQNAFVELLQEESFREVTVTQIARRALINRQTFYNYYLDKYDLTEKLTAEMLAIFDRLLTKRAQKMEEHESLTTFVLLGRANGIYDELFRHRQLILKLFQIQYDERSLQSQLHRRVEQTLNEVITPRPSEFTLDFCAGAFVNMVRHVLLMGRFPNEEEIKELKRVMMTVLS
ncbi:TetR family transcriptional regulator [Limosilactobacillus sp.]|jgi:AcrR family transcriptional regulator|uniref:TetR family transcriptional regulator n=1 Tax=Limosilactobacillus sp. TaxID=2773925 RepID=UPI0025BB2BD7|nr:TetR family transcriptional regulator [Limosilactobacillus sp.]MCH3921657.1 TetR/AcrR family transcriptional regulator [Limosilactobacillus sp.]MCH3928428.1 TetR/AcrR family transcriptional regulator [Limosilactobacillus sp.]